MLITKLLWKKYEANKLLGLVELYGNIDGGDYKWPVRAAGINLARHCQSLNQIRKMKRAICSHPNLSGRHSEQQNLAHSFEIQSLALF